MESPFQQPEGKAEKFIKHNHIFQQMPLNPERKHYSGHNINRIVNSC